MDSSKQTNSNEQPTIASECCLIPKPPMTAAAAAADNKDDGSDQVALITGSGSGIGRGTALAYAALNYRLVLVDKQADKLAETAQLCAQKSAKNHKVSLSDCLSNQPANLCVVNSTSQHSSIPPTNLPD